MAENGIEVIMPVLGMSQDRGKIMRWLKAQGQRVEKGEPLLEVETDKAVVEIEAPASGVLVEIRAREGQDVPVTETIAVIAPAGMARSVPAPESIIQPVNAETFSQEHGAAPLSVSPLAARIAAEHRLDLNLVKPGGGRVEKADVLTYLQAHPDPAGNGAPAGRVKASPKARRLAAERGLDLRSIPGSGPEGAVLAADVLQAPAQIEIAASEGQAVPAAPQEPISAAVSAQKQERHELESGEVLSLGTAWQLMAERTTASWTSVPHFFLLREVSAARLLEWRERAQKTCLTKLTITDLLVKAAAAALQRHPRLNASYRDGTVLLLKEINIGLAVAMEAGLAVPVIREAGRIGLGEIAARREQLVERARANRLRPDDLSGGTFTISNLGMYGVDAFNAVINAPQAAILAVGRIVDRVAAVNGQPVVQPGMILSASFDHRVVDGARAAQFLETLAGLIEEPLGIMN